MSEIRVEPVAYDIDGQPYEGQLVYDASHAGPRHVLDEAGLAATGGALEQYRQAVPPGALEDFDLMAGGLVEGCRVPHVLLLR